MTEKRVVSTEEKEHRYLELFQRLRALHYLRYQLLELFEFSNHDFSLYIEMNETISDEETRLWDYIEGDSEDY